MRSVTLLCHAFHPDDLLYHAPQTMEPIIYGLTPLKSWDKTNVYFSKLFPWDIFPVMKNWLSYHVIKLSSEWCLIVCECARVCVYVGVYAYVFTHVWSSEVCVSYLPLQISTLFCETDSCWIWSSSIPIACLDNELQVFAYLYLLDPGITNAWVYAQVFLWVVGIKTQVLVCAARTLPNELSPYPWPLIFDYGTKN